MKKVKKWKWYKTRSWLSEIGTLWYQIGTLGNVAQAKNPVKSRVSGIAEPANSFQFEI